MKTIICWLFGHKLFSFPHGTAVCKRCWKWWAV